MKVLQVHNNYLSGLGGEDTALEADRALLVQRGHMVAQFLGSNAAFGASSGTARIGLGINAIWSRRSYHRIAEEIRDERYDIAHVHNTFADLSASIYWALQSAGVPVVQTVHNYRWVCPTAMLLRDGKPCEECVGRVAVPALRHGCRYNGSRAAATVIATANAVHTSIGTYAERIDAVIALTDFMKTRLVSGGIPADRVHVRPNFLPDPGPPTHSYPERQAEVVFAGVIEDYKGVEIGASAWSTVMHDGWTLKLIGEGRLREPLERRWHGDPSIVLTGRLPRPVTLSAIGAGRFLALPSLCYEGLPMVAIEALSRGTPLIVPDHGAFPEIVQDGLTGYVFRAGDEEALRSAYQRALDTSPSEWSLMSQHARQRYLDHYGPDRAYERLMHIYEQASGIAHLGRSAS